MAWYHPTPPDKLLDCPWLSPGATEYLEGLLKPDMCVLEHGSGGSTNWLAQRVARVTSIENDLDWYSAVIRHIPANVDMKLWTKEGIPPLSRKYDLLLIDGEPLTNRNYYLTFARSLVKPGGWVVLDNCNRPEYKEERYLLVSTAETVHAVYSTFGMYLNTEFIKLGGECES